MDELSEVLNSGIKLGFGLSGNFIVTEVTEVFVLCQRDSWKAFDDNFILVTYERPVHELPIW